MKPPQFQHLAGSLGVLRHPCDLDLLLFFRRHPSSLLTTELLAAYVGYDLNQVGRSLDVLTEAGLLDRSPIPTHAARMYRMYVFKAPQGGWLTSLLEIASTPEGRKRLLDVIHEVTHAPADRIIGIGGSAG